MSPDRGDLFTTTGSRGVGLGPWFAQRSFRRVSESVSRVRISFAPPLAHRKPEMRSLMGPFFFLFQSGLARPSDFRRLAFRPKLVSEGPASLSIRPSSKSRRIQKVTLFQCFAEISLRRSCRRSVCSRCEQRHPKAAWLCGLVRFSAGGAGPRDRSG